MPRKMNPNSLANLRKVSKGGRTKKSVTLSKNVITIAENIGDGNLSEGLNFFFARMPTFYQAKLIVELAVAGKPIDPDYAAAVLLEMEELEIDRVHAEAVAEGVIQVRDAYIV